MIQRLQGRHSRRLFSSSKRTSHEFRDHDTSSVEASSLHLEWSLELFFILSYLLQSQESLSSEIELYPEPIFVTSILETPLEAFISIILLEPTAITV